MIGLNWRTALSLFNLTLVLGSTVAASWLLFGGRAAFNGPDRVLSESRPLIYGSQAILAAGLTWLVIRREAVSRMSDVLVLVSGAWIGELIALTLGGNLLANEIDPANAWFFWLMGTAGSTTANRSTCRRPHSRALEGLTAPRPAVILGTC